MNGHSWRKCVNKIMTFFPVKVQANDKGGLADAQSSGPGQTSSQAQIGFRPGQDDEIVQSTGGGQASAQSGSLSGQSQSQIQGTSK